MTNLANQIAPVNQLFFCKNKSLKLKKWIVKPVAEVKLVKDINAWQHHKMETVASPEIFTKTLQQGDSVILDMGESLVGYVRFTVHASNRILDAPLRMIIHSAELPYELSKQANDFNNENCRSWIQDEHICFEINTLPADYQCKRRHSLRYLKISIIGTRVPVNISNVEVLAVGAEDYLPIPPQELDYELQQIDQVSLRTLRNCMQEVFEDGPKRDRRLWLGDLYLQAKVNALTYKRFDIVEHCIDLFSNTSEQGEMMTTSVLTNKRGFKENCQLLDYSILFSALLQEHGEFSGNWSFVEKFYNLAKEQFSYPRSLFSCDGLFTDDYDGPWLFIDWSVQLNRQAPFQALYLFALKNLLKLAKRFNRKDDVTSFNMEINKITDAFRKHYYDPQKGIIFSGRSRQVSYASHAWAVIAGILSPDEGKQAFTALEHEHNVQEPVTPYMQHYVLEALFICGENTKALKLIRDYWGSMIKHGADTFWEIYVPGKDFHTPYQADGDPVDNSACHAWSCTPAYFLRRMHCSS